MNEQTAQNLLVLNRQFYQTFAIQFSATRQRPQPGVQQILERLPATARILDLGCGNGALWRELARRGHSGSYTGLDFSPEMLAIARPSEAGESLAAADQSRPAPPVFLQADLSKPDWEVSIPNAPFEVVLAFAVLHHLPGSHFRRLVLQKAHDLLVPDGLFIHSEWQFLNSQRLRARIQPWDSASLDANEVDQGDYLLDWRHGGSGLRYVHHFSEAELEALALETGFRVVETFYSDGGEGNLGLYQIWKRK